MAYDYFAYFDVDGTLIRIKSMFSFQRFYYENAYVTTGSLRHFVFSAWMDAMQRGGVDRALINARFYETFNGRRVAEVQGLAGEWYDHVRRTIPYFFNPEALSELCYHSSRGAGIVFVSGSFREILAPLAQELGACDMLATNLEVRRGRYTGRILPPQTIGAGKARAVREHMLDHGVEPSRCFAYGDHESDLPMLDIVGNPVVVRGDRELVACAKQNGWRVLETA